MRTSILWTFFFFTIGSIIFFHFYSWSLFSPLPQTSTLIICPYVYILVKCVGVCRIVCLNVNKRYCAVELMLFFLSPHHVAVSTKIDMQWSVKYAPNIKNSCKSNVKYLLGYMLKCESILNCFKQNILSKLILPVHFYFS